MLLQLTVPHKTVWTVSSCVQDTYIFVSCLTCWNLSFTVNTCTACLLCGYTKRFVTRDICMVSLYWWFCYAVQGDMILHLVCYKQYIRMVSLLNEFTCALSAHWLAWTLAMCCKYLQYYCTFQYWFLANVNSRSRSLYVVVRPSVCRLSVVCL